jgi:histidyl-tRNA synthetase
MKKDKKTTVDIPPYAEEELDTTAQIAHHYGFTAIKTPKISTDDISKAKSIGGEDLYPLQKEERIALMQFYLNSPFAQLPQPALLYTRKPFGGSGQKKKSGEHISHLEVINGPKPIAEAIIIKTIWSILEDVGHSDMYLEINSVGDKESFAKFERELGTYLKKHAHLINASERAQCKNRLFDIVQKNFSDESFGTNAPRSLSSLSEQSRDHFKEVLEFLEAFEIPYRLVNHLIPNKQYASHTVFEIRKTVQTKKGETSELLAYGGRYNYLAKKIGQKKEIPCCGATIISEERAKEKIVPHHKMPKPQFYIVQLGNLAKLKILGIIELLRKEKIPVHHSLTKEKIGGQLSSAEYLDISHVLIMGQKEAIDNTIVVRSVDTREQDTVFIKDLITFLKQILKKK